LIYQFADRRTSKTRNAAYSRMRAHNTNAVSMRQSELKLWLLM